MPLWEYTNARMIASSKCAQIQFKVDLDFTLVARPQIESVHALTGEYACPFILLPDSNLVLENCILLTALPSFPAFTKLSVLKLAHCFFQLFPLHSYEPLTKWLRECRCKRLPDEDLLLLLLLRKSCTSGREHCAVHET